MRIAPIAVVFVFGAACGTEQGAYLTLKASAGLQAARTYEVVLAAPDRTPVIAPQRVTPTGMTTEQVTYYLQATDVVATGTLDGVNGFTILVEPTTADGAYIPFLLVYDGAGALVGMGTFRATDGGAPAPILVKHGEVDRYDLAIEPVSEVTDAMSVDAGDAMRVYCTAANDSTYTSGIVWRPASGGELRVMLPDPSIPGDATARKLDLDCDGHEVAPDDTGGDCDDTRARFHAGATELCDGEDTACDGGSLIAVPCTTTNATCQTGVAVCDDLTGTVSQACSPDPACACANNGPGGACARCILQHAVAMPPPNETVPCQPGIGSVSVQNLCDTTAPCTVQVIGTRGGWDAEVGLSSQTFGSVATGVGGGFALKVKRPEGPNTQIPGSPGHTVGGVDLDVLDARGIHHYMGIDLEMDMADTVCQPNSSYSMTCSS